MVIQMKQFIGPLHPVWLNEEQIKMVDKSECLGITIDKNLNWKPQIRNVCKTLIGKIDVFKDSKINVSKSPRTTLSQRSQSYDKTSQGRKYYLLTISFSPDNTTCTCNFCQDKMRKGLGKRCHQFATLRYKVSRRKAFLTNASNDRFRWERFTI